MAALQLPALAALFRLDAKAALGRQFELLGGDAGAARLQEDFKNLRLAIRALPDEGLRNHLLANTDGRLVTELLRATADPDTRELLAELAEDAGLATVDAVEAALLPHALDVPANKVVAYYASALLNVVTPPLQTRTTIATRRFFAFLRRLGQLAPGLVNAITVAEPDRLWFAFAKALPLGLRASLLTLATSQHSAPYSKTVLLEFLTAKCGVDPVPAEAAALFNLLAVELEEKRLTMQSAASATAAARPKNQPPAKKRPAAPVFGARPPTKNGGGNGGNRGHGHGRRSPSNPRRRVCWYCTQEEPHSWWACPVREAGGPMPAAPELADLRAKFGVAAKLAAAGPGLAAGGALDNHAALPVLDDAALVVGGHVTLRVAATLDSDNFTSAGSHICVIDTACSAPGLISPEYAKTNGLPVCTLPPEAHLQLFGIGGSEIVSHGVRVKLSDTEDPDMEIVLYLAKNLPFPLVIGAVASRALAAAGYTVLANLVRASPPAGPGLPPTLSVVDLAATVTGEQHNTRDARPVVAKHVVLAVRAATASANSKQTSNLAPPEASTEPTTKQPLKEAPPLSPLAPSAAATAKARSALAGHGKFDDVLQTLDANNLLSPQQRDRLVNVLFLGLAAFDDDTSGIVGIDAIELLVDPTSDDVDLHLSWRPYKMSDVERAAMSKIITTNLAKGYIERCPPGSAAHPCFLIPKPDLTWRLIINYAVPGGANERVLPRTVALESCATVLRRMATWKLLWSADFADAFSQILYDMASRRLTTFETHDGTFRSTRVVFGLSSSPADFVATLRSIFGDLLAKDEFDAYFDDFVGGADNVDDLITGFETFLRRCVVYNAKLKASKLVLAVEELAFLGFVVGHGQVQQQQRKLDALVLLPRPSTVPGVLRFLGMASFQRSFVRGFAGLEARVRNCIQRPSPSSNRKVVWSPDAVAAWMTLRAALGDARTMFAPDQARPYFLLVDAAAQAGLGAVLAQLNSPPPPGDNSEPTALISRELLELLDDGNTAKMTARSAALHSLTLAARQHDPAGGVLAVCDDRQLFVLEYASTPVSAARRNRLGARELEAMAALWGCRAFAQVIRSARTYLFTDNSNLLTALPALENKPPLSRWLGALQEFNPVLLRVPGAANLAADACSRSSSAVSSHPDTPVPSELDPPPLVTTPQLTFPVDARAAAAARVAVQAVARADRVARRAGAADVADVAVVAVPVANLNSNEAAVDPYVNVLEANGNDADPAAAAAAAAPADEHEVRAAGGANLPDGDAAVAAADVDAYDGAEPAADEEPARHQLQVAAELPQPGDRDADADVADARVVAPDAPWTVPLTLPAVAEAWVVEKRTAGSSPEAFENLNPAGLELLEEQTSDPLCGVLLLRLFLQVAEAAGDELPAWSTDPWVTGAVEALPTRCPPDAFRVSTAGTLLFLPAGARPGDPPLPSGGLPLGAFSPPRVVVPRALLPLVLHAVHTEAHFGPARNYAAATLKYWWPSMRDDVWHFAQSCPACQRRKPAKARRAGVLEPVDLTTMGHAGPFFTMHVDLVVIAADAASGNKYVLTCVCAFSKWLFAVALPAATALAVTDAFRDTVLATVKVGRVVLDNGAEMARSRLWKTLATDYAFELRPTPPLHSQGNGRVEVMNKTILRALAVLLADEPNTPWPEQLRRVVLAHNYSTVAPAGISPFAMMTASGPPDQHSPALTGDNDNADDPIAITRRRRAREVVWEARCAEVRVAAARVNSNERYYSNFACGDVVIVWRGDRVPKTEPKFTAPHLVVEILRDATVRVAPLSRDSSHRHSVARAFVAHVSRLRSYSSRRSDLVLHRHADDTSPMSPEALLAERRAHRLQHENQDAGAAEVADRNDADDPEIGNVYEIDTILNWRLKADTETVECEVRWTAGDTTWESLDEVSHSFAFEKFAATLNRAR